MKKQEAQREAREAMRRIDIKCHQLARELISLVDYSALAGTPIDKESILDHVRTTTIEWYSVERNNQFTACDIDAPENDGIRAYIRRMVEEVVRENGTNV